MSNGKKFEKKVREYAAIRFSQPFRAEHLAGINFDAVATIRPDYKIIVEATENNTLEKVRGDIARLQIAKQKLIGEGIYAQTYIVLSGEPTNFMQEGAKAANIEVVSFEAFYREWYDPLAYTAARLKRPFGSAIQEGKSGPDDRPYVPVLFEDNDGRRYSLDALRDVLKGGRKVILTGEFGTGKSRAIQQLFHALLPKNPTDKSPLSIDLRHMWGTTSADEVLRRHFSILQMGAAADKVSDALHHDEFFVLLDGFDELAIQEWGGDSTAVSESRAKTMEPVRDLLNRTKNGCLVTGRAHYFNNDNEMLAALGLPSQTLVLSTPPEFSPDDAKSFMEAMGYTGDIPVWLPRKPLIAEMYADFANRGEAPAGDTRAIFWSKFMDALCKRDSQIRQSYDPEAIKQILCRLSRKARTLPSGVGPIIPSDVQDAFTSVIGQLPAQEAASMLQRLPGLGRVVSESEDRQFIDDFIIEGLRGLDVANIIATYEQDDDIGKWRHGAGEVGIEVIADRSGSNFTESDAINRLLGEKTKLFGALNSDIVSAPLITDTESINFSGAEIHLGYFHLCDFSDKKISNLHISEAEIKFLNIYSCEVDGVTIRDSIIEVLDGAASDGLPDWIISCDVVDQSRLDTVARIKRSQLKPEEMILVTILRKTFFQHGSGRKEDALLRGLGEFGDSKLQGKILRLLTSRGFLTESPGRSGKLFIPERSKTSRAARMVSQLQQSDDEVWKDLGGL